MPRRTKNIRKPIPRPKDTKLPRAQAIGVMTHPDSFECVDNFATCKALEGFSAEERVSMIDEANEIIGQRQFEQRLRVGRLRLTDTTWPLHLWPQLFRELPELEAELTAEQGAKLAAARLAEKEDRIARDKIAPKVPLEFPERKIQ